MFWLTDADVADSNTLISVPAPIGGLNARDSLAAMPPTDASVLVNWWPQPYGCTVRFGYAEQATGMPGDVETVAAWSNVDGTSKLFAWSGANMYDVSSRAAVGAAIVATLATARWDTCNPVNSAGSFLIALAGNGTDNGIIYKAAGVTRLTLGDGIVVDTWAGIDPKNALCPVVHQHRLWVLERNSTKGWYLPVDAIQGTFVKYDFGPLFSKGGYAQFMCTWTLDDGNGAEDHLIVVSSRGEAAVFGGTNPSSDATWALVGVYNVGIPVAGTRAATKVAGDVFIVTQQGVVSMTASLASTKVNETDQRVTSNKIQFLISDLTSTYGTLFGWDMKYIAKYNMVILNVPTTAGSFMQLAANQITNAWTMFNDVDARCWTLYGTVPYFGSTTGRLFNFWSGSLDNVLLNDTGGTGVISKVTQAYSYFGSMATQKQVAMYRPSFLTAVTFAVNPAISYDFVTAELTTPSFLSAAGASLWNVGAWDSARWGSGTIPQRDWYQAQGIGVAAALSMVTASAASVLWIATDYSIIKGQGVL